MSERSMRADEEGRSGLMARREAGTAQRRRSAEFLGRLLRAAADRLSPPAKRPGPVRARDPLAVVALPGAARLDRGALDVGIIRTRYTATDAIWHDAGDEDGLVGLREHVRRLCVAALELAQTPLLTDWEGVAHNLRLAHSLTDLFADTDIDGASIWCNPVADYEATDGELTEKHLAANIVFTFVWTAYECAIKTMTSGGGGKGARGRDLVAELGNRHLPHLRRILLHALTLDEGGTDFDRRDMRRMVRSGSVAGVAAEYLRQFRNRLAHGDVAKPEPEDWGARSEYVIDEDPHLRRFHANTRLLLLILQILLIGDARRQLGLESLTATRDGLFRIAPDILHCSEWISRGQLDLGLFVQDPSGDLTT